MATTQQRQVAGAVALVLLSLGVTQVVAGLDYIRVPEGGLGSSRNPADGGGWFNIFFEQPDAVIEPPSRTRTFGSSGPTRSEAPDRKHSKPPVAVTRQDEAEKLASPPSWVVQVGSFESLPRARRLEQKLRAQGHRVYVEKPNASGLYRVRVGPYSTQAEAQRARVALHGSGTTGWVSPR